MTRTVTPIEASGSPSAADFETAVNLALSTILTQRVGAVDIKVTDRYPNFVRQYKLMLDTDTVGGLVITNPYRIKVIEGDTDQTAKVLAEAYMAANPAYWFSQIIYEYSDQVARVSTRSLIFLLYNVSAADGAANWAPGYAAGGASGAAGGDLSGTYPNPKVGPTTTGEVQSNSIPASATAIATQPTPTAGDVEWEVKLKKGTTQYSSTVRAQVADGVTPNWQEYGVSIYPAIGGTFDCPLTVTIVGPNIRLMCTPATTGWSARSRARTFTP